MDALKQRLQQRSKDSSSLEVSRESKRSRKAHGTKTTESDGGNNFEGDIEAAHEQQSNNHSNSYDYTGDFSSHEEETAEGVTIDYLRCRASQKEEAHRLKEIEPDVAGATESFLRQAQQSFFDGMGSANGMDCV